MTNTQLIVCLCIFLSTCETYAEKISILCGQDMNFTLNDGCFIQIGEDLWIKFLNLEEERGEFHNETLYLESGNYLKDNIPKILFIPSQNYCLVTLDIFENEEVSCGMLTNCDSARGYERKISKTFDISIFSLNKIDISGSLNFSNCNVLKYLKKVSK